MIEKFNNEMIIYYKNTNYNKIYKRVISKLRNGKFSVSTYYKKKGINRIYVSRINFNKEQIEELIKEREAGRLEEAQLLMKFEKIQKEIIEEKEMWKKLGLQSKEQFPIFKTFEKIVDTPKEFTLALFDKIGLYLEISDWKDKDDVKKEIRKNIKSLLRNNGVDKELVNSLPITILEILENQ